MNINPIQAVTPEMRQAVALDLARDPETFFSDISAAIESNLLGVEFAIAALLCAARFGFLNHERRLQVFNIAQAFGAHFLPVHYYSPVPDTSRIEKSTWDLRYDDIPGLAVTRNRIAKLLTALSPYSAELKDFPFNKQAEHSFYFNNPAFGPGDSYVLYTMLRHYRPHRIIEIGSGFSTLLSLNALSRNGRGEILCVEPYPNEDVSALARSGLINLIQAPVQSVDPDWFKQLGPNDVLFIDGTHVCKVGSDVNYAILKILPRIGKGVLVHFHDIYLPFEIDKASVCTSQLFWNEQYILAAFMAFNESFEVLLPNMIFYLDKRYTDLFRDAFPACPSIPNSPGVGGGSFWFTRIA